MERSIKDTGKIIRLMEKAGLFRVMEIFMKAIGSKIKCKVMEFMNIQMEDIMQESGKIINNMVMVVNIS